MTVASLWTVLDEAGCGKAVGAKEMVEHDNGNAASQRRVNPWNYNETNTTVTKAENRMSLAVDLSIWICEALTSTAMSENHAEPALHLVYTRTTRLLSLGIKLVVVIEGKRRVRGSQGERDSFRKRRSGTAFWKACKSCEEMLRILGVTVVRAKAEGEALCALLNQRGIVDGVISNDGDCLLFGAKVVYTRFSLDNLDKGLVIRYDVSELRGCLRNDEQTVGGDGGDESVVSLERGDLISFALLTGSDLAGDGLPKVGHKKAIRFIKQCKLDYPLSPSTAAIDELKSWARTALASVGQEVTTEKGQERCCSLCCHPGDKRSHQKHGCELCGTEPGEPCFESSSGDKFRNSLRLKALAMIPKFDPAFVMEAYMNPNDNQVPIILLGETARSLRMSAPRLGDMLSFPYIIKGRSLVASKEYVKQSVARLLARAELANHTKQQRNHGSRKNRLSREKPIPIEITRKLVHNKTSCYEISWVVNATTTDGEGNEIDGYEFSTIEAQALVEKRHSELVQSFLEREKEEAKQGDAEANRRRDFVHKLLDGGELAQADEAGMHGKKKGRRDVKRRSDFFGRERSIRPRTMPVPTNVRTSKTTGGDDVHKLMAVVNNSFRVQAECGFNHGSIQKDEESTVSDLSEPELEPEGEAKIRSEPPSREEQIQVHGNVNVEEHVERGAFTIQDSQTPVGQAQKLVPPRQLMHPAVTEDASFPRIDQNASETQGWNKRSFFDDYLEPSSAMKRLRWSILDPAVTSPQHEYIPTPRRDFMAATPVVQTPVLTHRYSPLETPHYFLQTRDLMSEEETPLSQQMPALTPGHRHSMVCDMGIKITITPLVSSKYM
jgi:hypothetical protein